MAKRNKITPLHFVEKETEVDNVTETEENLDTPEFDLETGDVLDGFETMGEPETDTDVDTSGIDTQIASLDAAKSADIWEKQAASYRQQGEGNVLRTQKNLTNLFGPTLKVIATKEKMAEAKFNILKSTMKEFDDSKIFGQLGNSEIDIATEAKSISTTVKEDMRELSRMNINHPRYDELRKKIESDQGKLANYDIINKTLLEIRNSGIESKDWSKGMTPKETAMWQDIFTSNGKNITIEDGKMYWQGEGESSYDFGSGDPRLGAKFEALGGAENPLSLLVRHTTDSKGKQMEFKNGDTEKAGPDGYLVSQVQRNLKAGGFTDGDGNELEVDNEWGPKSQAAYDKYLSQKDKLEKAYLDENLPEDSEFRTTENVDRIELNSESIGAGPKLLSNKATKDHQMVSSAVIEWKNNGGELGEMYEFQMGSAIQDYLDGLEEGDVKSLIFDGFGDSKPDGTRSTKKAYSGFNTEGFMMDIIKGTYGEDLNEEGIESKVNEMRGGSMYDMYTLNGEKDTLKNHFDNWYREEQKEWFEKDTDGAPVDPTKKKVENNKKKKKKNNNNKTDGGEGDFDNPYETDGDDAVLDGEDKSNQQITASASADIIKKYDNFAGLTDTKWKPKSDPKGRTLSGILFNYGNDALVKNTLNREYGGAGFEFTYDDSWSDTVYVSFKGGEKKRFKFNKSVAFNLSGNPDLKSAEKMQEWMREMVKGEGRTESEIKADEYIKNS